MNIIQLLEHLAKNTHYDIDLLNLLEIMPEDVKQAFRTNNQQKLKSYLGNDNQPDRSTIFHL